MPLSSSQVAMRWLAKNLIIVPFITVVGFIDSLIHLVVPYKYEDPELPDKSAVLTLHTDKNDPSSPYRSSLSSDLIRVDSPDANLYDEMAKSVNEYRDMPTMGVRECFSIEDEPQPNGKVFKKLNLGTYKWSTYEKIFERINHFSSGLAKVGLKPGNKIVLFAETRPEWIVSAYACFRLNVPVVTLYSTLGIEALAFGINQTDASYLITSGDQLGKIEKILAKVPKLTHIIVLSDKFTEPNVTKFRLKCAGKINVVTANELEQLGAESKLDEENYKKPGRDDLAVIMYTSGSTGNPKGVMISHGNLLTAVKALYSRLGTVNRRKDIYVAYLPLAHVLELVCEITCMTYGLRVAYSTPQTIADNSTAIKKGQKGDLRILKPTIMASVPIVLERLSKTVYEKLAQTSWFKQCLFKVAYQKKLRYFRAGRSSRLLDRILFKRISSAVLGGKCRLMLSGGAILSKEVHEFVQVCLCPVLQAYGLTETCGAGTTQLPNQTDTEIVGSVVPCCELKLVDWPEGGYRITDKPNSRGEIYIGGENIALGYYDLPDKTKEDFFYSKDGIRYFATGDIGEMLPNGNVKIIDRKKDIVKLQGGEYVSLNKVESVIKLLTFVDNCCLIADPTKPNCVVLVCPNLKRIREYIQEEEKKGKNNGSSANLAELAGNEIQTPADIFKYLDEHPALVKKLVQEMSTLCLERHIDRFEIPTKIGFVKEAWVPESGLVTDSLKLKRKEIEKFYKKEIDALYSSK